MVVLRIEQNNEEWLNEKRKHGQEDNEKEMRQKWDKSLISCTKILREFGILFPSLSFFFQEYLLKSKNI